MVHKVIQVTEKTLKEMEAYYQKYPKKKPPHSVFQVKVNDVTITAYQSKKVMFQGPNPDIEANRWQGSEAEKVNKPKKSHNYTPEPSLFHSSIIGSDETGTGDYFGPITVVSAYVEKSKLPLLKELGVRDSKNIKDDTIKTLAKTILQLDIPYSLMILPNPKYNALQKQGWTQGKMKTLMHHAAINATLEKISPIKPDGILVDQFSEPDVYIRHLKSEGHKLPVNSFFITKAESHALAVAVASILARYSFIKEMDKLSAEIGTNLPKGASHKVDQAAAKLIKQHGQSILSNVAKVHFKNTEKAEAYL